MSATRLLAPLALAWLAAGCAALNYPTGDEGDLVATEAANEDGERPAAPVLMGMGFGEPELAPSPSDGDRAWYELTREARLARARGEFDEAKERLEQAALQLADRPSANAQRRAVHGMRARIALDLLALDRTEQAMALADTLFAEAAAEPAVGGPATVDLVLHVVRRRAAAAASDEEPPESPLPLLRIALTSAEEASPSVERLNLAYEVSQTAMREGDANLARRAIDRAVLDAQTVNPTDLDQLASLRIYKARIARAQGDLETAEASAIAASQLFDEARAHVNSRVVAEATLALIVAKRGDEARARAIMDGALARLEVGASVADHARRTVLGEAGRLERELGDRDAARAFLVRAIGIPAVDFGPDKDLVADLTRELAELDSPEDGSPRSRDDHSPRRLPPRVQDAGPAAFARPLTAQ